MTDDIETKLGVDAAACDDEVFSISLRAKHVLAKVRSNLLIHCSNCTFAPHIHLKMFDAYYQHKRPTLNVIHCKGKVIPVLAMESDGGMEV